MNGIDPRLPSFVPSPQEIAPAPRIVSPEEEAAARARLDQYFQSQRLGGAAPQAINFEGLLSPEEQAEGDREIAEEQARKARLGLDPNKFYLSTQLDAREALLQAGITNPTPEQVNSAIATLETARAPKQGIGGFARHMGEGVERLAQGATLGYGDEITGRLAGGLAALTGGDYDTERAMRTIGQRERHKLQKEAAPISSLLLDIAGGTATGAGIAGAAAKIPAVGGALGASTPAATAGGRAGQALARTAGAGLLGATEGGLTMMGEATGGLEERAPKAKQGAILGGALGAGLGGLTEVGGAIYRGAKELPLIEQLGGRTSKAEQVISQTVQDITPADFRRLEELQSLGKPATIMDVSPDAARLGTDIYRRGGVPSRKIQELLTEQGLGQQERLLRDLDTTTGYSGQDYAPHIERIERERGREAARAYPNLYATPVPPSKIIDETLSTPAGTRALSNAETMAANERAKIYTQYQPPQPTPAQGITQGPLGAQPTPTTPAAQAPLGAQQPLGTTQAAPVEEPSLFGDLPTTPKIEEIAPQVDKTPIKIGGTEAPNLTRPDDIYQISPKELKFDAKTYQYKEGGDATGATDRLKGVKEWDDLAGGQVIVHRQPDGEFYVADGHQRVNLAKRLEAEGHPPIKINARVFDESYSPEDVMMIAAKTNIKAGSGTALDAAKIFRLDPQAAAEMPPNSAMARDAKGLAQLEENVFKSVVNGEISPELGAVIGRKAQDYKLQDAMVRSFSSNPPSNLTEAGTRADMIKSAGIARQEAGAQTSFLEDVSSARFDMMAKIADASAKKFKGDSRVFTTLTRESDRIAGGGNILDEAGNINRAEAGQIAEDAIRTRIATKGSKIAEAAREAAEIAEERGLKEGQKFFDDQINDLISTGKIKDELLGVTPEEMAAAQAAKEAEEITIPTVPERRPDTGGLSQQFQQTPQAGAARGAARAGLRRVAPTAPPPQEALTFQGLDYVQRALRDMEDSALRSGAAQEARSLGILRKDIIQEMESANPDYKKVREMYAEASRALELAEVGRKFLSGDAQSLGLKIGSLTKAEREALQIGASSSISSKISKAVQSPTTDASRALNTPDFREKLKIVYGDETAAALMKRIQGEQTLQQGQKIIGGSPTAQRQETGAIVDAAFSPVMGALRALTKNISTQQGTRTREGIADFLTSARPQEAIEAARQRLAQQGAGRVETMGAAGGAAGALTPPTMDLIAPQEATREQQQQAQERRIDMEALQKAIKSDIVARRGGGEAIEKTDPAPRQTPQMPQAQFQHRPAPTPVIKIEDIQAAVKRDMEEARKRREARATESEARRAKRRRARR